MNKLMDRISPVLAIAAVILGLLSPLGAFAPLQTGYWNLVDSSFIAILVSGLLAAAWIAAMGWQGQSHRVQCPPSALFLLLLAAAGTVAALNAAFPLVALVGTYQSGYGPLWHLVAALLIMVAGDLMRHDWAARALGVTAIIVATILSATLAYSHITSDSVLIPSSDSYALIGFFMLFIAPAMWGHASATRLHNWALRLSGVALIVLSKNMALIAVLGVGACVWLLLQKKTDIKTRLQRIPMSALVLFVIVLAALPLGVILSGAADVGGQTLRMRTVIADIMVAALQHSDGVDLVVGHGWGHTQAAFYQYLHWGQMVLFSQEWDFLWRDMFHSHNVVIETFYSVGAIGLLCLLAFWVSVYVGAPAQLKVAALAFVAGYVLYSAVWYDLSFHLPYMALALASLNARRGGDEKPAAPVINRAVMAASVVAIIGLGSVVVAYTPFSHQVYALKPDRNSIEDGAFATASFPIDPRGTDFVRAMLYRDVLRRVESVGALHNDVGVAALNDVMDDVARRLAQTRSPELVLSGLDIFNNIVFVPEWAWAVTLVDGKGALWNDLAVRSQELAPYRSDLLVPYFTHLLATEQYAKLRSHVQRIEMNKPNDPVGLYYLGAMQSQSPQGATKQQGLMAIAKAMDCGLERFVVIPPWLAQGVQAYRGRYSDCPADDDVRKP